MFCQLTIPRLRELPVQSLNDTRTMAKAGCNAEESPSRTTSAHTFPAHELYVQPTAFRFEPSYRSQSPFTKEIGTGKLRRGRARNA